MGGGFELDIMSFLALHRLHLELYVIKVRGGRVPCVTSGNVFVHLKDILNWSA